MNTLNWDSCGKEIEPGGFIVVLAEYPTKEYVGEEYECPKCY